MAVNINTFPRLPAETSDSPRIQRAINATSSGEITFPAADYIVDSVFTLYEKISLTLRGEKGATLSVNGLANIFNIIGCQNVIVDGFIIKDRNYTSDVYFKEIPLDKSLLTPNTNPNINVSISGNEFTISTNTSTVQGTEHNYIVTYNIPLADQNKEHTIQTYDGIVRGENCGRIKIRQYDATGAYKEYLLDQRVQDATSPGNNRWQANYIPANVTKVELLFSFAFSFALTNNPVIYDWSKVRLFQATKDLVDSTDNFNISIQRSSGVSISNNEFIGLGLYAIKVVSNASIGPSSGVIYKDNKFYNCFVGCVDISSVTGGTIQNNQFIVRPKSDNGDDVFYTKTSSRGITGVAASSNITIRDNYAYGLGFAAEIWYSTNLVIYNFIMENTLWGLSICNNCTGQIYNCNIGLKDNYIIGIELANAVVMTIDNVNFKGRSYKGFILTFTDNTAGQIVVTRVNADSCMVFAQWTNDSVFFRDIHVKELLGTAFLALGGKDYTNCNLTIRDTEIYLSNVLKISNLSYKNTFIRTSDTVKSLNKVELNNVLFHGTPNSNAISIKAKDLTVNNLITTDLLKR